MNVRIDIGYVPYTLTIAPQREGSAYSQITLRCNANILSAEYVSADEIADQTWRLFRAANALYCG